MSAWANSTRRSRLPANWRKIRKRILIRDDYRCQVRMDRGRKCGELATDVDHIRPGDDHRDENLQSICDWHHKQKSAREGAAAAAQQRKQIDQRFRRTEAHPGLL